MPAQMTIAHMTNEIQQVTIAQMTSTQRTNAQGIHTRMTIAPHENEVHKPKAHNKTHTCAHVPSPKLDK